MGYSFKIISRDKEITKEDFLTAISKMSEFNKKGLSGLPVCDYYLASPNCIWVSGSFGISGQYAEGFVLNLVINLIELGYVPKVLSRDFEYGSEEDFKWLNNLQYC